MGNPRFGEDWVRCPRSSVWWRMELRFRHYLPDPEVLPSTTMLHGFPSVVPKCRVLQSSEGLFQTFSSQPLGKCFGGGLRDAEKGKIASHVGGQDIWILTPSLVWEDSQGGGHQAGFPALPSSCTREGVFLLLLCSDFMYALLWIPLLRQFAVIHKLISKTHSNSKMKYKI